MPLPIEVMLPFSHFRPVSLLAGNGFVCSAQYFSEPRQQHALRASKEIFDAIQIDDLDPSGPALQGNTHGLGRTSQPQKLRQAAKAKASRLEQSSTKPAAVRARKPSETRSWS